MRKLSLYSQLARYASIANDVSPKRILWIALAKAACPIGSLVLTPDSVSVNSCEAADLDKETFDKRAPVSRRPTNCPRRPCFFLHPLVEEKRVGAFWFVEPTADRNLANMQTSESSYSFTTGVESASTSKFVPRIPVRTPMKRPSQKQLAELPEDAQQEIARIPVLVNFKAVCPGDVLHYFRAETKALKRDRAPEPLTMAKVMRAQQK